MASLWSEEAGFGLTLRELQILHVLWAAGEPLTRFDIQARFHEIYDEPVEASLIRHNIWKLDNRDLLHKKHSEPKKGAGRGQPRVLYWPKPSRREFLEDLLETLFNKLLAGDPRHLEDAIEILEKFQAQAGETADADPAAQTGAFEHEVAYVLCEGHRIAEVAVVGGKLGAASGPPPPPKSWASRSDHDVAIWTLKMAPGAEFTLPPARAA